ncbi:MAG: hypothetical protein P4N59_15920 [Negativicutes bacterium]|nr:hypothetical protein [Negativicutes bacterium]
MKLNLNHPLAIINVPVSAEKINSLALPIIYKGIDKNNSEIVEFLSIADNLNFVIYNHNSIVENSFILGSYKKQKIYIFGKLIDLMIDMALGRLSCQYNFNFYYYYYVTLKDTSNTAIYDGIWHQIDYKKFQTTACVMSVLSATAQLYFNVGLDEVRPMSKIVEYHYGKSHEFRIGLRDIIDNEKERDTCRNTIKNFDKNMKYNCFFRMKEATISGNEKLAWEIWNDFSEKWNLMLSQFSIDRGITNE